MTRSFEPAANVSALSLVEQASLTSGADFWRTKALPGIPSIMLTDGPHGVRKQDGASDHLGLSASVPATCFPPAVALGSSFDVDMLERVGSALGQEARAEQVGVLLGPGMNIKRSPLCGRNFEYLSEDPYVSGILGGALVRGIQSQGVGASVKHFAVNNQETDRMRVSADIDPRPLREIYLRGFQWAVQESQPWTVMCSYNRINGVHASQNRWLLNDVLRNEWGFEGVVVSDWGAVVDKVASLEAGLDLEMPSSSGRTDAELVAAVSAGRLNADAITTSARRVADLAGRVVAGADPNGSYDAEAHHKLAREAAGASIVLLKNDGLLPLAPNESVAVIGELARSPRYQGAGSSQINPTKLENSLDEIRLLADADVLFAAGYDAAGTSSHEFLTEAAETAAGAEAVVLFLGLPAVQESEGFDREDIELPVAQLELLDAVVAANARTVVVLANGGVVRLSGLVGAVPAIVEGWLLGQAGGGAIADVLYGVVNPSGRLAETIPVRLADTPAHLDFPGEHGHVRYGEGVFVGYRWYDAREMQVTFPFGHGLSYTEFHYGQLAASSDEAGIAVSVAVTNSGTRPGAEVVQVYAGLPESDVARAPRELKGFAKVFLEVGETREVEIILRRADLAVWDTSSNAWHVEGGSYEVSVGSSSRVIHGTELVAVPGDKLSLALTPESSMSEVMAHPIAGPMMVAAMGSGANAGLVSEPEMMKMLASAPIGRVLGFPGSGVDRAQLAQLLELANSGEAAEVDSRPEQTH